MQYLNSVANFEFFWSLLSVTYGSSMPHKQNRTKEGKSHSNENPARASNAEDMQRLTLANSGLSNQLWHEITNSLVGQSATVLILYLEYLSWKLNCWISLGKKFFGQSGLTCAPLSGRKEDCLIVIYWFSSRRKSIQIKLMLSSVLSYHIPLKI